MPPKRQYSAQTNKKLSKVKNNCHDNLEILFKIIDYRNAPSFRRLHIVRARRKQYESSANFP
jgi:hypothetical protein